MVADVGPEAWPASETLIKCSKDIYFFGKQLRVLNKFVLWISSNIQGKMASVIICWRTAVVPISTHFLKHKRTVMELLTVKFVTREPLLPHKQLKVAKFECDLKVLIFGSLRKRNKICLKRF